MTEKEAIAYVTAFDWLCLYYEGGESACADWPVADVITLFSEAGGSANEIDSHLEVIRKYFQCFPL